MTTLKELREGTFSDSRVRNLPGGNRSSPIYGETKKTPEQRKAEFAAWVADSAKKKAEREGKK